MLGNDTFQPDGASILQKLGTIAAHVLRQLDRAAGALEQILEEVSSDRELCSRQIVAVEIKKVESIEDGFHRCPLAAPSTSDRCKAPNPIALVHPARPPRHREWLS